MKKLRLLCVLMGLLLSVPFIANAFPTSFSAGSGYQDYAYAGLGNSDEVLAFAEFEGSLTVGSTISYTLYGDCANYVERVRVWARPYESSTETNSTGVPATYAFPFDNRHPGNDFGINDPATNIMNKVASGATLVAETTDITATSMTSTINLESGQYVIYLTADLKSADEVTLELGRIFDTENYTKVGGVITDVNGAAINTANALTDGNRVLVTLRQALFTSYDFYSKYYRIPCITTTSDGTLIAVSDARKYHAHDIANDIDMLVRRSTDNGKTWSAPIVVAKGEISGTPESMNHEQTIGYGDASIAAMPNGKVLLCMVKGNKIAAGSEEDSTWVAYRVSDDNGITWNAEKTIPAPLLNNARGCIAPGNMCVVQEGVLKGKVLAAFRAASNYSGDVHHGNIFLIYDPDNDRWTRAYSTYSYKYYSNTGGTWSPKFELTTDEYRVRYIYQSYLDYNYVGADFHLWGDRPTTNETYTDTDCDDSVLVDSNLNGDDESVIVEVAENTFLVSHRVNSSPYRAFTRLVIESTPGVETGYKYTPTELTSTGFTATNANGSIIKTTDANGKTYLIHAVPKSAPSYNGRATRTALTIYTAEYDGSSTSISWKERVCLSDPFNLLEETAQYSSMTYMADGTIGYLFEEYPQAVYATSMSSSCSNSDFIMRSVFMNVRPSDLIEEWGDADYVDVASPEITPESQTYHAEAGRPRPEVVITNPNGEGTTTYNMIYKNADGTATTLYDNATFTGTTLTVTWDEIAEKLGIAADDEIPTGTSIIVTAKVSIDSNGSVYESTETQSNYLFRNPVRKVMIFARPITGSGVGNPTIVAGSQTAGPGEIITVGVDAEVSITAFGATENPMITFSHFAYPGNQSDKEGTEISATSWATDANVRLMAGDRQVVFNMKDESVIPNNYAVDMGNGEQEDVLVLYVLYNSQKTGFKSQVTTSAHAEAGYTLLNEVNSSALSTNDDVTVGFNAATGFTNDNNTMYLAEYGDAGVSYVDELSSVNYKMTNSIIYTYAPDENGNDLYEALHLNVAVQPDVNSAQNLNAVVLFIQNGQYLRNANGSYLYALLQGQMHHHDVNDPIVKEATYVLPWYGLNNGVYVGKTADMPYSYSGESPVAANLDNSNLYGVKFYDMQDLLVADLTEKPLYVMIFVISNLVTDVKSLINTSEVATNAMYVHVHGISKTTIPTAIEGVTAEDDMIIVGIDGGAQFIGNEPRVDVYNTMGMLVETFSLNGVRNVELPAGVYIANGKKFVVR